MPQSAPLPLSSFLLRLCSLIILLVAIANPVFAQKKKKCKKIYRPFSERLQEDLKEIERTFDVSCSSAVALLSEIDKLKTGLAASIDMLEKGDESVIDRMINLYFVSGDVHIEVQNKEENTPRTYTVKSHFERLSQTGNLNISYEPRQTIESIWIDKRTGEKKVAFLFLQLYSRGEYDDCTERRATVVAKKLDVKKWDVKVADIGINRLTCDP